MVVDRTPPAATPAASADHTRQSSAERVAAPRQPVTRWLVGLTAAHALNDIYGFVLPPLLPALRVAFGLSYLQAGFLVLTATGVSAALQPIVGYIADRRRWRRPALAAGFLLYAVGMVLLSQSRGFGALLLAAGVMALASAPYHPQATTLITRMFPYARGWAAGIHGIGNSIGMTSAPLIVGVLAQQYGWQTTSLLLAGPALIGAAYVWWLIREPMERAERGLLAGISRPLLLLTLVHGLISMAGLGFITFLPAYYYEQHGSGLAGAGLLTAMVLTAGVVAQPLGGGMSDRIGRQGLLVWAAAGVGATILLFALVGSELFPIQGLAQLALLIGASFMFEFAVSLTPAVVLVYASELASGGRSGTAVGTVWGLGIAIGAAAAPFTGWMIDTAGFGPAHLVLAGIAGVAAMVARFLPRPAGSG